MTIAPEKPMDLAAASQRISWLDEERHRDHAELARLTQEMASALAVLKDQVVKMRETDGRLNAVETSLTRIPRLEDAITAARSEMIPLRDTDIKLQEDIQRHEKDRQVQADQSARAWGDINARLETLSKSVDGLLHRIQMLDAQRQDQSERQSEMATRLDSLIKTADALAGRLHLLETREHDRAGREGTMQTQIADLVKVADSLGGRIHLLETREQDRSNREGTVAAQITRLDVNQSQAIEEVKRSVARAEAVMTDSQQLRREIILAQQEEAKKHKDDSGIVSELHESLFILQRRVDEVAERDKPLVVRIQRLEDSAPQTVDLSTRLLAVEEQLGVVQATYKGLQEVEDRHWNTDIPMIQHEVEEASNTSQTNAATVQELVAASQALKEAVRELQVNLVTEHVFSEDLAAALRGLIEEDLQTRLATTQKQLQTLRRLANTPVESQPTDE